MRPILGAIAAMVGLTVTLGAFTPVSARRATCEEITGAQARGLSVEDVRRELRTTAARIEACAHSAEMRARHAERRERAQTRRAARRGVEP
jgi:hypothetical protein